MPSITRSSVLLLALVDCGSKKTAKDRYVASLNAMCTNFAAREQRLQLLAQRNRTLNAELGQIAGDLKADSCAS